MKNSTQDPCPKKPKRKCKPPFDFFGISPSFYINGSDKTVSYAGFVCSLLLIGTLGLVSFLYALNFIRNKNYVVYTTQNTAKDTPLISLGEKKFLLAFRSNYPEHLPYFQLQQSFFTVKVFESRQLPKNDYMQDRVEVKAEPCDKI